MKKVIKILIVFLVIDIVVIGGYFLYKNLLVGKPQSDKEDYEWVIIDESYSPRNFVEEFIKKDTAEKGLFPISIRNYGKDTSILRKFRGSNFARPTEAQLNMMYKGLEDWMLIDLKYKTKKKREAQRTILYIQLDGTWKVGDSGSLLN